MGLRCARVALPSRNLGRMLELDADVWGEMVGHAYDGLPDEACGLFAAAQIGRAHV